MKLFQKMRLRKEYRNQMESQWLRDHFRREYDIDVGMYSYGCFDPTRMPRGLSVGRYCSFSNSCVFLNANHVLDYLSLHPYLYNKNLGLVSEEPFERRRFVVEEDVWIGHNAVITAAVARIGRGAVIGAGAVVTRDVAPYEVVGGVPARTLKYRFDEETRRHIDESKWWEMSKNELAGRIAKGDNFIFDPAGHFNICASGGL